MPADIEMQAVTYGDRRVTGSVLGVQVLPSAYTSLDPEDLLQMQAGFVPLGLPGSDEMGGPPVEEIEIAGHPAFLNAHDDRSAMAWEEDGRIVLLSAIGLSTEQLIGAAEHLTVREGAAPSIDPAGLPEGSSCWSSSPTLKERRRRQPSRSPAERSATR